MSRPRFIITSLLALTLVAIVGYMIAPAWSARPDPPPRSLQAGGAANTGSYPRLANYNGLRQASLVPFFSGYGLVIARRGAPLRRLRRVNPHAISLLYERSLQVDLCCVRGLYGLSAAQIPPRWWLVLAGSRLARPLGPRQQWVTVTDPRPFRRCQDVLVDGESMHVWAVHGHRLHVLRGYFSTATRHRAGTRIVPHYSYRSDLSNCRLSGRGSSMRPWSFNLSTYCPRWHGQTWADFLAHRIATLVRREGWRGVFYDNLSDFPPSPLVDVNNDGHADGGIVGGVNAWRAGERALLAETRRLLPGAPLLVNGDLLINGLASGREMEGFPLIPGLAVSAAINAYLYDGASGAPLTIVNPDSVDRPFPSMPAVQLAVGAALLGDGYTAYDHGWLRHGAPWWFDEYDGGAGSATPGALDAGAMLAPVAHPRRFQRGDVVFIDQEAARVLRVLGNGLLLQRGISGTVSVWHAPRTAVTTAAQRAAAHGYLGTPLGPARLVPTAAWWRHILPLSLRRGAALVNGRPQRSAARPLGPRAVLQVDATVHYDPYALRLTLRGAAKRHALRTLVFTARGPEGQALWIDDGNVSAPVPLRHTWRRYVLPVSGSGRITLGLGRIGGRVEIRDVRLIDVQAFILRRDFTRGVVLVNPTDVVQRLALGRPYRLLSGDQNPWANTGRVTRAIAIARYRATILLNASQG